MVDTKPKESTLNKLTRVQRSPLRRLGRLVVEIGALMVLFQCYKIVRKTFAQRDPADAFQHAEQILRWERWLKLDIELDWQRDALRHEWIIRFFNHYYAYFMWAFYICAALAILRAPRAYARLRAVFVVSALLALPWYALYPLAPPRFMTADGFVDTLAIFGPNYFSENGLVTANRYAAMPSMHVGWTAIAALMLAAAVPEWRLGSALGMLHLCLLIVAVIVTGNHYVLDIAGGLVIAAAAFGLVRLTLRQWQRLHSAELVESDEEPRRLRPILSTWRSGGDR